LALGADEIDRLNSPRMSFVAKRHTVAAWIRVG